MISWRIFPAVCLSLISVSATAVTAAADQAAQIANPAAGRPLRHLVIGDSVEAVQQTAPGTGSGFVLFSPAFGSFDLADLNKRLSSGENQLIEERLLAAIAQVIENFFRQNGYPVASVIVPTQSIAEGVVRLIVTLGIPAKSLPASEWKIRKINMQGARWFSDSLLREKLRIEQGETVRLAELDQAIGWTNNNPYRRVKVQFDPVPNTGEADLTIAVQDALPLRLTASVDNGGNSLIGRSRYVAAISYGNVWGKDHQVSYQYITTNKPQSYQAHGFDYRIPTSWRHYLQFSASYFHAQPQLPGGFFSQDGETITSDLRYGIPLTKGQNSSEVYASLSFKQSNNNLTWDPTITNVQIFSTKTDIFQLTLGASTVRRDKRGAWAFGASLTASPGGINSRNTDAAFDAETHGGTDSARLGATAKYAFVNFSAQRLLSLAPGWDLMSRAVVQLSEANLLSSEQLAIGGASTVRGFNENIFAGDHGFVFSNELMAPSWRIALPRISKTRGPIDTRGLLFFDIGSTSARHPFAGDQPRVPLAGCGVGLRMSLATNFSLSADYGWQITYLPYPVDHRSRGHIRATLAF
jgi:hemolysin activation/secretion protein